MNSNTPEFWIEHALKGLEQLHELMVNKGLPADFIHDAAGKLWMIRDDLLILKEKIEKEPK